MVSKKADHSVLRLLQISQQHIESQLDRVRHERELWKEVVDKRAQQPLQLALTLKDPHTGQPMAGPGGMQMGGMNMGMGGMSMPPIGYQQSPRPMVEGPPGGMGGMPGGQGMVPQTPGVMAQQDQQGMQKASP